MHAVPGNTARSDNVDKRRLTVAARSGEANLCSLAWPQTYVHTLRGAGSWRVHVTLRSAGT